MGMQIAQQVGECRELVDDFTEIMGQVVILDDTRSLPPPVKHAVRNQRERQDRRIDQAFNAQPGPKWGSARAIRIQLPEQSGLMDDFQEPLQVGDKQEEKRAKQRQAQGWTGFI